jgi:hypothetical protein
MADLPFEGEYFLRSAADPSERICWYVQRDGMKEIEERGLPSRLQIPEDKLLLLRDNG